MDIGRWQPGNREKENTDQLIISGRGVLHLQIVSAILVLQRCYMKKILGILAIASVSTAVAQTGYEIRVTFKPFTNQYIYLGHYHGKSYPIIDSVMLDDHSTAIFKGDNPLRGGTYLVGYPGKKGFFEILVDKQQHFSIIADTSTIKKGVVFLNSPDNKLFNSYQQSLSASLAEIAALRAKFRDTRNASDSLQLNKQMQAIDSMVKVNREDIIRKQPSTLLATYLIAMREPILPGKLKNPKNKEDSLASYLFFKDHFWDGIDFGDGRLVYTSFFDSKIDKYFNDLVIPQPDSLKKEIDWIMYRATPSDRMTRFLLTKFLNRYINPKYTFEDAVFLHIYEKYVTAKELEWIGYTGLETLKKRVNKIKANMSGG